MNNEKEKLIKRDRKKKTGNESLELSGKDEDVELTQNSIVSNHTFDVTTPQRSWATFIILVLTPILLCPLPITLKSQVCLLNVFQFSFVNDIVYTVIYSVSEQQY